MNMNANTNDNKPGKQIHSEFRSYIEQQPYSVVLDGIRLTIDNDVFPPDMGKCSRNMASIARDYPARTALDMGCGSGYLALSLKRSGVQEVWASDIHGPAVECARRNVKLNEAIGPVQVVKSDLFKDIPEGLKFDLIIFNQPFGPGQGDTVCGCGPDGGYRIVKRFLQQAVERLNPDGVVMMAFSDREPVENSPDRVAADLGYPVKVLLDAYYGGANNYIYEIRPQRQAKSGTLVSLAQLGAPAAVLGCLQRVLEIVQEAVVVAGGLWV
jgi:release factor glutamine methyltransferase